MEDTFGTQSRSRRIGDLEIYIIDVSYNEHFMGLKGIGDLSQKMVQTGKK